MYRWVMCLDRADGSLYKQGESGCLVWGLDCVEDGLELWRFRLGARRGGR